MTHDLLTGTKLRTRAAAAIDNERLGSVLREFTDSINARRLVAERDIANHQELKDAARALRSGMISRLPDVLSRFADELEARGVSVYWATDAQEACAYVTEVATRSNARLGVKSKSMVTEEIGLNEHLQAAGVEVVETDLGEYIVQLADEMPSHILAPAIHMDRRDIAALFNRISGGDLSDVPAELIAFARGRLREKFLQADLGISGCNFGVAETGTLVLVTNEGNGRLVTSIPKVHVAIMGMERLVETWDQLDLMMTLLTRASTGQDISVYVNHLAGPRRANEVDGPEEMHVVIVDNGRSNLLATEFQEMLNCIRCGACINVCPVYRHIGGSGYGWIYSGPMGAVLTPLLNASEEAGELREASSLCGACHHACPVGIPLQDLLLGLRRHRAQEKAGRSEKATWAAWASAWSHPSTYRASTKTASVLARIVPDRVKVPRWGVGRDAPQPPPGPSFRVWLKKGER